MRGNWWRLKIKARAQRRHRLHPRKRGVLVSDHLLLRAPTSLQPLSRDSLSLQMHEDARVVFRTIGKLAGLNVIFDPEFPENKKVSIDLINVTLRQALRVACVEAKAF